MSYPPSLPAAGWYSDPAGGSFERWWNGTEWTTSSRPFGVPDHGGPVGPPQASAAVIVVPASSQAVTPSSAARGYPGAAQSVVPAAAAPSPYVSAYGYGSAAYAPGVIGVWRTPADNRPLVRGMGDAIKVVFSKYATFEGRASRSEYWYWTLFNGLLAVGALLALLIPFVGVLLYVALIAWAFCILLPNLAVTVRRLRDAGYHWAWLFLSLIPFGGIALIVLCVMPSKHP